MDKADIEGVRVEFKRLIEAMVDMARANGQPLVEIMPVSRDGPRTIDALCDLALKGLAPEARAITLEQQEVLADIFANSERHDKITLSIDRVSNSITVRYEDLDEEWLKELGPQVER